MKLAILGVKLLNFREDRYWSAGDSSINIHWILTLSISQTKVIVMGNIFECLYHTNIPANFNIWYSEIELVVQKYS